MFAVCAARPNLEDPPASLVVCDRPEAEVPDGWVRVKISHARLNRHDWFTLRGITAQPDPIPFPMILGNATCYGSGFQAISHRCPSGS
jgi:NADPH:quinone reductase-like Zn-dependent oxidoreductase